MKQLSTFYRGAFTGTELRCLVRRVFFTPLLVTGSIVSASAQVPQIPQEPTWRTMDAPSSQDVAWIDFDGDGDLDLAFCNDPGPLTIHRNDGGALTEAPGWTFDVSGSTTDWGDVDQDGDLDVACGYRDGIFIYANDNQSLMLVQEIDPLSPHNLIGDLLWFDHDQDGDLDLSSAGANINAIYANTEGTLGPVPVWNSQVAVRSNGMDWGDYDRDGDADLLVANFDAAHEVYANDRGLSAHPVWRSGGEFRGQDCQWVDVDSDGWLDATFANWGSLTVHRNVAGSISRNPTFVTPHGSTSAMAWADYDADGDLDLATATFAGRDDLYRNDRGTLVKAWESMLLGGNEVAWADYDGDSDPDLAVAKQGYSAVYRNDEGTLAASTREIAFPVTTLGDTTTQSVVLTNRSGQRLQMMGVNFSSSGFHLPRALQESIDDSLTIEPGASLPIEVHFAPTSAEFHEAVMSILSVGAVTQTTGLRLMGQPRPIEFEVDRFFYPRQRVAVESDVRILIRMADDVHVDSAIVHLSHGGASQTAHFRMTELPDPINERHLAMIPASSTNLRGLEYSVEVFNGPSSRVSGMNRLRFETRGFVFPFLNRGFQYRLMSIPFAMEGPILGSFADELGGVDATRWRLFAYDAADSMYVEAPNDSMANFVQGRGYWLVTRHDVQLDTGPAIGVSTPTDSTFAMQLEPGFHLISSPFLFPVSWDAISVNGLSMHQARDLMLIDGPWRWITEESRYNDVVVDPVHTLEPFDAYWVFVAERAVLQIPPVEATPRAFGSDSRQANAHRGRTRASLDSWLLRLQAHTRDATDGDVFFGVDPAAHRERDDLDHFKPPSRPGPWVYLAFANRNWSAFPGAYGEDVRPPDSNGHAWAIEVRSATRGEEIGLEWFDAICDDASQRTGEDLLLRTLPADLAVALVDEEQGSIIPLVTPMAPSATYHDSSTERSASVRPLLAAYHVLSLGPDRPYRMTLIAGTMEYVSSQQALASLPTHTALDRNAPNPFNARTRIRFALAALGHATLQIYNVRGELVITLVDRTLPAGYHTVLWDGKDSKRHGVASGVYVCRLLAGGTTSTRRLVLLE